MYINLGKRDELLMQVENLIENRKDLEYIFVECSGLADPGSTASIFWVDEELESNVYLDSLVTFVDAKHLLDVSYSIGLVTY
jgi:G3E family GTPase